MKKGIWIALIIMIIILVLVLYFVLKNGETEKMPTNTEKVVLSEKQIEAYNKSFGPRTGTDEDKRNGENVKKFIEKIIETNNKTTNDDDLILLHFESWKGTADSNGDEESTKRVYDCIGDERSTYKIIVDEYTEDGKIKKVTIKWLSGTASEPEIPEEIDEFEEEEDNSEYIIIEEEI